MKLSITTNKNKEVIDITDKIADIISNEKVESGICNIHILHTTASITTADLDPGTDEDLSDAISVIIPKLKYRHPHDPSHTPDHIASSIIGTSISIPFKSKKLLLGTWQRVVLIEFSGPRKRDIIVTITS